MTRKNIDRLVIEDDRVLFISVQGKRIDMPNLTTLVEWYKKYKDCFFSQFPYGMVIMRDMFKPYRNTEYSKSDIEQLIK